MQDVAQGALHLRRDHNGRKSDSPGIQKGPANEGEYMEMAKMETSEYGMGNVGKGNR